MNTTALAFGFAAAVAAAGPMTRGVAAARSCDELLPPAREVRGQKVGPASCLMQEAGVTYEGRAYTRVDIGLDGAVDGFAARVGDYKDYFTNGPDLVFPHFFFQAEDGIRDLTVTGVQTCALPI